MRKVFVSVKGIYYQVLFFEINLHMNNVETVLCCIGLGFICLSVQAEIQGQKITWLTPHALQQVLPDDVDYTVMLTFLEFNEVSS